MHWYELEFLFFWKKNYVNALIVRNFIKERDRFIREFPTFRQQQELKWASIQTFRILCSKVIEVLHNQLSDKDFKNKSVENKKHISDKEITDVIEEFENINAYLYSIEALMERILDIKVARNVEFKFNKNSKKFAHETLNLDRWILDKLFNQNIDLPDKNNFR